MFDLPNLSPRSEALRIEEAAQREKEQAAKAEQIYKQCVFTVYAKRC